MVQCSHYWTDNELPVKEELEMSINIANKFHGPVLLMFPMNAGNKDCDVRHVFIHSNDTIEDVYERIKSNYRIL